MSEQEKNAPSNVSGLEVLPVTYTNKTELFKAYMSFVSRGGVFVPTDQSFEMGKELVLLIQLPEEPSKIPVTGKVVWITPKAAEGGRVPGIGIQFISDEAEMVTQKIERLISGMDPTMTTDTL